MKRAPDWAKLENILRSSKLVSGGFLGRDTRPVEEIIDTDVAVVSGRGRSVDEIAERMRQITREAERGMGNTVAFSDKLEAEVLETMGKVPCPWPHPGIYGKTVTVARRKDTGQTMRWSELNIHLIEQHGFFEGKGSAFRIDPQELIKLLFEQ